MELVDTSRIAELSEAATVESLVGLADGAMRAELGIDCRRIAGGLLVRMRAAPFIPYFTRAFALGVTEPLTDEVLDEVTESLKEAGGDVLVVQVAPPQETEEVVDLLIRRGWERGGTWAKMMRPAGAAPDAPTSLRIERIGADLAEEFGRVLIEGMEMPPIMNSWAALQANAPHYSGFGALDGDVLVGVGVLHVRDGAAQLAGAATLPDFRGRGAQLALMAARIEAARDQGAQWVTAETGSETPEHPNPSLHNMYRAGLTLLYHRRNWLLRV
jgi:GNAT superfamily N-acetyltransferase